MFYSLTLVAERNDAIWFCCGGPILLLIVTALQIVALKKLFPGVWNSIFNSTSSSSSSSEASPSSTYDAPTGSCLTQEMEDRIGFGITIKNERSLGFSDDEIRERHEYSWGSYQTDKAFEEVDRPSLLGWLFWN